MATKIVKRFDRVKRLEERASFKNLGHAGAVTRKVASGSIRVGKKPSAAGSPPHTRKGAFKKGILYGMDGKERVVIGTSADLVGPSGKPHEQGGRFRGQVYQKRPFMNPALSKVLPQIPPIWRDSIRE